MLFKKKKEDAGLDDTSFIDDIDQVEELKNSSINTDSVEDESYDDNFEDAPEIEFHDNSEKEYYDELEGDEDVERKFPVRKLVLSIIAFVLAALLFGALALFGLKGFGNKEPKMPDKQIEKPITNSSIKATEETQKVRIIGLIGSTGEVHLYDGAGKVIYSDTIGENKSVAISEIIQGHNGGNEFYGFDKTNKTVYKLVFEDDKIKRLKLGEIKEINDITDVVSDGGGTYYVASGATGLWQIDKDRKSTKILNESVEKFDINKGFILYSSGSTLGARALSGGNIQKLDMKSNTASITATKDDFLVLSEFGKGLDNSIAMFIKPSTLGADRIIELKEKGLNICGVGLGRAFVEQDTSVKEIDINDKKPLRSFKKDKKTKDIVCSGNSVYERNTDNRVTYKTLERRNADLGDFVFTGAKMFIFGK